MTIETASENQNARKILSPGVPERRQDYHFEDLNEGCAFYIDRFDPVTVRKLKAAAGDYARRHDIDLRVWVRDCRAYYGRFKPGADLLDTQTYHGKKNLPNPRPYDNADPVGTVDKRVKYHFDQLPMGMWYVFDGDEETVKRVRRCTTSYNQIRRVKKLQTWIENGKLFVRRIKA